MRIIAFPSVVDRPEAYLIRGLKQRGVEIEVLGTPEPESRKLLEELNIPITECSPKSKLDFRAIKIIKSKLAGKQFDIIHSFSGNALANSLHASIGTGIKHIAYRGTVGHLSRFDPSLYLTYFNPRLDKIMCVSDAVKNYLEFKCRIKPEKLARIYKGHDLAWYKPGNRSDLESLGIPKNAFVLTMVANMRPVKGADVLLKAALQMEDLPNLHILLIGNVVDKAVKALIPKAQEKVAVHPVGFRDDAAKLVGASDAFILPSIEREGLPKSVIEAMAQAVPVIVTSVGGIPELVENEVSGLVIAPSDPLAIKQAVLRYYSDSKSAQAMGEKGREVIKTRFNINQTIDQVLEMYNQTFSIGQLG
jgi:glycosyltransferase involved in cell wall biosynthesis